MLQYLQYSDHRGDFETIIKTTLKMYLSTHFNIELSFSDFKFDELTNCGTL